MLGDDAATQDDVDGARDALQAALDALVKDENGDTGNGGAGGNGGTGDGGNTGNGGGAGGDSTGNGGTGNGGTGGTGGTGNDAGPHTNGSSSKPSAGGIPQTGDPATIAVAGAGLLGSVAAALGALIRRRRDR